MHGTARVIKVSGHTLLAGREFDQIAKFKSFLLAGAHEGLPFSRGTRAAAAVSREKEKKKPREGKVMSSHRVRAPRCSRSSHTFLLKITLSG